MQFFDEIKDYVGFTDDDARRLMELLPLVEPHFPDIVASFYDALMRNPRARGVFVGPEQIERLRGSLRAWMRELFAGPHDMAYYERRMRIGQAHVNVGLLPQFMFGAMNRIRVQLVDIVAANVPGDEQIPYIDAVERVLDIDLTLMVQSYWDTLMKLKLQIPAALATGLAHEIRNPLNAIGLQMTLLERKLRNVDVDSDVFQPVLEAVRSELRRIHSLNSEIMDFAKPVEISARQTDIRMLLSELHQAHSLTLEAGGVNMEIVVEGSPIIWCDGDRLYQVLVNMLTNAVEAMEDGGQIAINVQTTTYGSVIDFSDTGQGMPPAMKYRIFDLFFTTKASGTGIGLPIARKIIEAHGGSIDVTSRPGAGTTFKIYLPRPQSLEQVAS
jgi:signal transduction histidine kinase